MLCTMVSMLAFIEVVASNCENCANCATKASFFTGSKGFWFFNWVVNKVKKAPWSMVVLVALTLFLAM